MISLENKQLVIVSNRTFCLSEADMCLSPLLVNLYLADFLQFSMTFQLNCFMFANDVVLLSETASGPRLNIKTVLSTYGDFHVKDKTAARTSYL